MKHVRVLALLALATGLTGCGFEIVDTGYRGVQTRFGEVYPNSLPEGFHWYNPFTEDIVEMDVREIKWEFNTMVYTKDIQQAKLDVTVNYRLKPSAAPLMLQTVGENWSEKIVGQEVYDGIKNIAGHYDADKFISSRGEAVGKMFEEVQRVLAVKNVEVIGLAVTNIDFDDAYEKAVERKVVAAQDALAAVNKTSEVVQEGEQNKARANADAEAMRARAAAIRENQNLIEWERLQVQKLAIQQWKGQVPQYQFGGASPVPFMSIDPERK